MKTVLVALVLAACTTALPLGGVAIDPITSAKQIAKVNGVNNLVPRVYSRERDLSGQLERPRQVPSDFEFDRPNAFSRAIARSYTMEPREKPRTRGGRFPRTLEHEDEAKTDAHPKHKGTHAFLGGGGGTNRPSSQLADFTEL
ncbi:hypothetical protein PENSPDRAFT_653703 [Peniophora sp. CONT]|nr:hypothetical protein PENSPDRAFT_653703 [Peniophora sp. CONT]